MTLEDVTALLAGYPLKFHPGTHWNYGLSTDIVGRLVEIMSGERFDDYLQGEIFGPLGMTDTGFFVPEESAERFSRALPVPAGAAPRAGRDRPGEPLSAPALLPLGSGRAGLDHAATTSPSAGCSLNGGHLDGRRILGRKTLELMTGNHLPGGATLADMAVGGFGEAGFDGVGFGLGFAVGLGPGRHGDGRLGRRLLLGRSGQHRLLGRSGRGPLRRLHDPAPPLGGLSHPGATPGAGLPGDR